MNANLPLFSIITTTYNRAHTIERAVNSVLNQTYKNIELIIIDDGSTDNTVEILGRYNNPQIRLYRHEKNKGVTAAKNSGLDQIKGEWFTILDSDDEIVPGAIETMMKVPLETDLSVTAVTCNCRDTTTNEFSGKGLAHDQYIDINILMTVCKGEFWGITKTSLLQNDRFNEKIKGLESILWYKIDGRAKRFYLHSPLRIYHTEGNDRIMKSKYNFAREVAFYEHLITEEYYLTIIKQYRPADYHNICKTGLIVMSAANNKYLASKYYDLLKSSEKNMVIKLAYKHRIVSLMIKKYMGIKLFLKPYIYGLLKK